MKSFLSFLLLFFSFITTAQVPEPHMLSLKGIGGAGNEMLIRKVIKTDDGGFILGLASGSTPGTGNVDSLCTMTGSGSRVVFIKYSSDMSVMEWAKCSRTGTYMFCRSDGSFIFGGTTNTGSSGWAFKIVKEDALGNNIWYKRYGGGASATLRDMMATEDGGYIMLGETYFSDTDALVHHGTWETADLFVIKVDSNGYKVWSKVIGGSYDEGAIALVPAPGNGCYVIGATQSSDYDCSGYHAGGQDAYLARLDADGNILWHRCLGGSGYEAGYNSGCGVADGNGGVLMAVSTTSTDGDVHHHIYETDYWALDIDSAGNIVWENCYNRGTFEFPASICKATDGSIWINGYTSENYDDVYLIHADSVGDLLHSKVLTSYNRDQGEVVHPLKDGLVFVGGSYYDHTDSFAALHNYGFLDVFYSVFAPWPAGIKSDLLSDTKFKIYPNPAGDLLHIRAEYNLVGCTIVLSDINGRRLYTGEMGKGTNEITIDVSEFAKGSYYVRINNEEGYQYVEKIIIK